MEICGRYYCRQCKQIEIICFIFFAVFFLWGGGFRRSFSFLHCQKNSSVFWCLYRHESQAEHWFLNKNTLPKNYMQPRWLLFSFFLLSSFFLSFFKSTCNSHIVFLLLLVCSCGAGSILAFSQSIQPFCNIIIIWPDALIRPGELSHPGMVCYVCSAGTLFYQLHWWVTEGCVCLQPCPFLPFYLCWQQAHPSTHSPLMQCGRPTESSSHHRWGKHNSRDWQSKGGVWPAVEWGVWLASAGSVAARSCWSKEETWGPATVPVRLADAAGLC